VHVLDLQDTQGGRPEDTGAAGDTKAIEHARAGEDPKGLDRPLLAALQRKLEQLAVRAQRFTPRVSLVPPDGLLLEVKGSLHLFNGPEGLLHALEIECHTIGVKPALALTPTPLAAMVVARSGKPFVLTNKAQLVGRLSPLPLTSLRWPQNVLERLARMGIRTIGQVLRLPRAGFARRFGAAQLAELDRLTGRSADLRQHFQARERFRRRRELTCELEDSEGILAALRPLLADLGKFLQARQCGVMQLECQLRHRHAPVSRCMLRLAAPLADVARLTQLLGERLSALALPEPVRSCELRSGPLLLRTLASASLWQPGEHGGSRGAESPQLIELLRARLGSEAVYGLQILTAHRPENTWSVAEPGSPTELKRTPKHEPSPIVPHSPWAAFRRPLWLLHAPQLLEESGGMPLRRGPLRLFGDVERIETSWWDGGEIGRDYYRAFDIYGVQLWIFRERAVPHRWFLHGVFG
jgi:protein ImuB